MCHVLRVNRSGYYAWLKEPLSDRARENQMIVGQIKQAWLTSGKIDGYRKIHDDLQDLGLPCGEQRVYRLMKAQGLRSQTGYKRKPSYQADYALSGVVKNSAKVLSYYRACCLRLSVG